MSIQRLTTTIVVVYSFDEETELYTLGLLERGGPIVVDRNLEEGKKRLRASLQVASALRNLQYFDDISIANRTVFNSNSKKSKVSVEFRQLVAA